MFRPYVRVCRVPGVAIPLVASFLGALAICMQALAVLLLVQHHSGSFARAGLVTAALGLGSAAGLVGQGRLLDRYGHARVLSGSAAVCGLALVSLTLFARAGTGPLSFFAIVAGASVPAVPSAMRVLIPRLVAEPALRQAAYALLAVQFQVATVVGPLLAAGLLAAGPAAAVLCAGGLAVLAALGFARTGRGTHTRAGTGPRATGAASPGVHTIVVSAVVLGAVGGLVGVGVPAVAIARGAASLAGVLLAVAAAGGMIGGLVYGRRSWPVPMRHQLVLIAVAQAVVWGLALTDPRALLPVLLVEGFIGAPVLIIWSALLDTVAHPDALARSYTLLVAASLSGIAGGSYAAGVLVDRWGPPAAFAAVAALWVTVAAWTLARRRTL